MNLLPKPLRQEEFNYYSEKSVDILRTDIQQLLEKTEGWNFSTNLTGAFTSDLEFNMMPKWQFIQVKGIKKEQSFLYGRIFQDDMKRTRVMGTIRPNSVFPIFFFLFPLAGLAVGIGTLGKNNAAIGITVAVALILIVPTLMLFVGHYAKKSLRNTFTKTFDLKQID